MGGKFFIQKIINCFLILILFLVLTFPAFAASTDVQVLLFYGEGCPHCARAERFFNELIEEANGINLIKYETYFDQKNREIFEYVTEAYSTEIQGVPMIFIDDVYFVGFNNEIANEIKSKIELCLLDECENPLDTIELERFESLDYAPDDTDFSKTLTISAVLSAAAVDAINPCAFAVLIILLTTVLASKNRKRALFAGLAFSSSVFISYFLMGIGIYTAIKAANITHIFYIIVSILAIIIGLFNIRNYFGKTKFYIMKVPISWRPKMKALIRGVTSVPGAFIIGFIVSLFLLPCTSGPYILILGLLASATERSYAMLLLLLYNFIFVLPMLLITSAVYFGFTSTKKAEQWRQQRMELMQFIAGLIILTLGIVMLTLIFLGSI
ncbi:cytochrome c biogenesis protein CcdA [Patescibacteria group bacterium]